MKSHPNSTGFFLSVQGTAELSLSLVQLVGIDVATSSEPMCTAKPREAALLFEENMGG